MYLVLKFIALTFYFGASDRNRTGTPLLISDFKSEASTNFATLANLVIIIYHTMIVVK